MRLRHLKIRIMTDKGLHGTDISFPDGLVVLWADNSMGKSTCIRAVLVALGLEAMVTPSQMDLPLPPAMKSEIESDDGLAKVIESDIYLEIENQAGDRIVIHRSAKGTRSKDLITVSLGPALSKPDESYRSEDYFVARSGAATRERGFHKMLADFLGWKLPIVQTFDGREYPLYMQCIFPYFIVDQTRGWANIDPPIPSQFRIKEPHKRSIEFILNLDANRIAAARVRLDQEAEDIGSRWSAMVNRIDTIAKSVGGVANKPPQKPIANWPPEILPFILLPDGNNWISAHDLLANMVKISSELAEKEIPRVGQAIKPAENELAKMQEELSEKETMLARLLESFEIERGEISSVAERLNKIDEDLQRNKDVKILLSLGSMVPAGVANQTCPTCHQNLIDSLTPLAQDQSPMSIDENIVFLDEQKSTFQTVAKNIGMVVLARESQITGLREVIARYRSHIRALKQTLVSDERLPSKAVIQTQIEIQQQVQRMEIALEEFDTALSEFEGLASQWKHVQSEICKLPANDTTDEDRQKLLEWNANLVEQLHQYEFKSVPSADITISVDTYKPVYQGFDLQYNVSASDLIRIIWSYLTAILELGRTRSINHPGLLIFDEPKQQSTKDISFAELLKRVSNASNFNQQVIFATSKDRSTLKNMLMDVNHKFIEFDGRILRKIMS